MHVEAPALAPDITQTSPRPVSRLSTFSLVVIGLFGFLLPLMWIIQFAGGQLNTCAADILVLPAIVLLRGRLLRSGGLGYWILALWLVNVISWTANVSLMTTADLTRECLKLGTCYLYAFLGSAIGRDQRTTRAFIRGIVWAAIAQAALGLFSFFTHYQSILITEGGRVMGTFGDPNAYSIFLAMAMPLLASAGLGWPIIPMFIAAGAVSFSRTGLAAIGASLTLNSLTLGGRKFLIVAVACALIFVSVYTIGVNTTTVGKRVANYEGSLDERQSLWSRATGVIATHPLIGIGKGNWEVASGSHVLPHNMFLSVAADGGLIGLAVFIAPIMFWVLRGLRHPAARPWAIAVLVGMVGGLAISLDNFRPFWLALGVLSAQLMATHTYAGAASFARANVRSPRNRHWG